MHCLELHSDNFKGDFLNISIFFLHPQIPVFQIVVFWPKIVQSYALHASVESLFIQLPYYV